MALPPLSWLLPILGFVQAEPLPLEMKDEFVMIEAFAFSPDGRFVAGSKSQGGEVVLWDPKTRKQASVLKGKADFTPTWLAFSSDGRILCGADSNSETVGLWDMRSGRMGRVFPVGGKIYDQAGGVRVALGGKGKVMAVVLERKETLQGKEFTLSGTLTFWDAMRGRLKWKKDGLNVMRLAVSPDGKSVAVGTITPSDFKVSDGSSSWVHKDPHVRLLSATNGKEQKSIAFEAQGPNRLGFVRDGKTLVGAGYGRYWTWDAKTLAEKTSFKNDGKRSVFHALGISKDGKRAARGALKWSEVVDLDSGDLIALRTSEFPRFLKDQAFSPDLRYMACTIRGPVLFDMSPSK